MREEERERRREERQVEGTAGIQFKKKTDRQNNPQTTFWGVITS